MPARSISPTSDLSAILPCSWLFEVSVFTLNFLPVNADVTDVLSHGPLFGHADLLRMALSQALFHNRLRNYYVPEVAFTRRKVLVWTGGSVGMEHASRTESIAR
jgi:hypothetical protein